MPTGTLGTVARKFQTDQVHYHSVTINGALGAQTVNIGIIPAGASAGGDALSLQILGRVAT